jgi:hypothetical protein
MKAIQLSMVVQSMMKGIDNNYEYALASLDKEAINSVGTNEEIAQHADIHNAMASFILSTAINAWAKKLYDNDKKLLDQCVETIGIDSDGVAGMTKELYSNEVFAFNKRCNNDTTAIAVKDVIIALQRRGIDQDRLDQALDEATKPKKGNTYYVVGVADA